MLRLLRRLKVEMNGAVAGAMERGGIRYGLNYGVSIPTIRDIAGEYGANHSLALLLFAQDVRELKLAALFIDDPAEVTAGQMRLWSRDFNNAEIVEQTAMRLFSKAAPAYDMASEWIMEGDGMLRYAGMLTASGWIRRAGRSAGIHGEALESRVSALMDLACRSITQTSPDALVAAGTVAMMRNAAEISPALKTQVAELAEEYNSSSDSALHRIGAELAWLIEN